MNLDMTLKLVSRLNCHLTLIVQVATTNLDQTVEDDVWRVCYSALYGALHKAE
jgi:hypothetical protein